MTPQGFVSHPIPDALAAAEGYPQVGARVAPTSAALDPRPYHYGEVLSVADVGVAWQVVATGTADLGDGLELVWLVTRETRAHPACRYLSSEAWERRAIAFCGESPAWQVLP